MCTLDVCLYVCVYGRERERESVQETVWVEDKVNLQDLLLALWVACPQY